MAEILKVCGLSFSYGKYEVLKNINFSVNEGEFVSLIGENGSGKSTLFKVISGISEKYKGDIIYKGRNIKHINRRQRAIETAAIFQNEKCAFPFTCFEVIAMGLFPHKGSFGKLSSDDILFLENLAEKLGISEYMDKSTANLSGGEVQRVMLAKALAQKPKLLLLDEAMSGMDISGCVSINNMLVKMCEETSMSVLSIRHDIAMAFEKSHKLIALKNGEVYSQGKPRDLLNKEFFREVFNVEVEIEKDKYFRFIG